MSSTRERIHALRAEAEELGIEESAYIALAHREDLLTYFPKLRRVFENELVWVALSSCPPENSRKLNF